jgi:hypothetical protein
VPPKLNEKNIYERREVPRAAIDVLALLPLDGAAADAAGLRGDSAAAVAIPPSRLVSLAGWLANVCREPAAIWWASGQTCLHPILLRYLTFQLDGRHATPLVTRTAWRYLIEAWRTTPRPRDIAGTYAINERLSRDGWTPSARRELANVLRAFLSVERPYGAKPPDRKSGLRFGNLIRVRVEYPTEDIPVEIPDGELASMLPLFRRNLEEASELERELNPTALRSIPPIEPDPDLPGEPTERNWRINANILKFAGLFKRLTERDAAAAKREFVTWRQDDEPVLRGFGYGWQGSQGCSTTKKPARFSRMSPIASSGASGNKGTCFSCWRDGGPRFLPIAERFSNGGFAAVHPASDMLIRRSVPNGAHICWPIA